MDKRANEKVIEDFINDVDLYGSAYLIVVYRPWWNPLRYILGPLKLKRVDPTTWTE